MEGGGGGGSGGGERERLKGCAVNRWGRHNRREVDRLIFRLCLGLVKRKGKEKRGIMERK